MTLLQKSAVSSLAAAWLLSCPVPAAAQDPDPCVAFGSNDARGVVCRVVAEERGFVLNLQKTAPASDSCALVRTAGRIDRMLGDVARGTGLLPVYFTVRTVGSDAQRREVFADEPDAVVIEMLEEGAAAPTGACMAGAHRDAVLRVASTVGNAVHGYNQPFLKQGAGQLRKLANTWAWVISDGFGQYPWERAFNDLIHRDKAGTNIIANLPKIEWVLLHPSVGVMLSGVKQLKNSRGQTAFFLEPLGFIRYRLNVDTEKRSYWGASALVVATADQPPAVRGLLRVNKYSFGVARHLGAGSTVNGRWGVTATMELLERLQPARKGVKEAGEKAGASGVR